MSEKDDELLGDSELAEALTEADRVLAEPAKEYRYGSEYKGGPRNIDADTATLAIVEIASARLLFTEMTNRAEEAELLMLEAMEEQRALGVPIDLLAEHSGLVHRSSVYRALDVRLPQLRKKLR